MKDVKKTELRSRKFPKTGIILLISISLLSLEISCSPPDKQNSKKNGNQTIDTVALCDSSSQNILPESKISGDERGIDLVRNATIPESKQRDNEGAKTMVVVFEDVNSFEGSIALIFRDESNQEVWLSYFECDISKLDFYYWETADDEMVLPICHITPEKKGRKYKIHYIEQEGVGDFSGEIETRMVVTRIEPLE